MPNKQITQTATNFISLVFMGYCVAKLHKLLKLCCDFCYIAQDFLTRKYGINAVLPAMVLLHRIRQISY